MGHRGLQLAHSGDRPLCWFGKFRLNITYGITINLMGQHFFATFFQQRVTENKFILDNIKARKADSWVGQIQCWDPLNAFLSFSCPMPQPLLKFFLTLVAFKASDTYCADLGIFLMSAWFKLWSLELKVFILTTRQTTTLPKKLNGPFPASFYLYFSSFQNTWQ